MMHVGLEDKMDFFFPDECEVADVLNAEACCAQRYLRGTQNK